MVSHGRSGRPSTIKQWRTTRNATFPPLTGQSRLIGISADVFGTAFPAREHGVEVVPAVQPHHDDMAGNEGHESAHGSEMPDAGESKAAEDCGQPPELHWFE